MMQTSRPGIFAAGDIATFPGKLKLIATGFGEACVAVNRRLVRMVALSGSFGSSAIVAMEPSA